MTEPDRPSGATWVPSPFVLIGVAALVLIFGIWALRQPSSAFRAYALVPAAPGVRVGSPVQYRGIDVGRVSAIAFADSGVRLTLDLTRDDVPLRVADTIRIAALGLFGDKVVDLRAGSLSAPRLAQGGELRVAAPIVDVPALHPDSVLRAIRGGPPGLPPPSDSVRAPPPVP